MKNHEFRILSDNSRTVGAEVESDGVHFGYYPTEKELPVLLLYRKGSEEIAAEIPFQAPASGDSLCTVKVKFQPDRYEYNFRDGDRIVTDPCAKVICGRSVFGQAPSASPHGIRGGFVTKSFDWGEDRLPEIPYEDAVMYHLHLRGFTMQKNSGVRRKGTFSALKDKIPYLTELGVNQIRLMPVYDFAELTPRFSGKRGKAPEALPERRAGEGPAEERQREFRMNYWGYGDGFYFAPKSSYASRKDPVAELKEMIKAFHAAGIEVIPEFAFTDRMDMGRILQCLDYWAAEYHVDGFAVIGRNELSSELAKYPLFRRRKLICGWYPDSVVRDNEEEPSCRIAASNDGFMNDCRRLLKGDENALAPFADQLKKNPPGCAQINYITNHDGFTLADLVSYDRKYNQENGEQNRDGSDYNLSWNCGAEGPTKRKDIQLLRMRQRKNAFAMMLFAQGTPMLLAGDEFGNSQNGNNNPYCHDSELTWTDWSRCRSSRELTDFVKQAVAYRRRRRVLHQSRELKCADTCSRGCPDLSFHGERAWFGDFEPANRHMGCMYSGYYAGEEGFLYIAYNLYWARQQFALPLLPKNHRWYRVMDTSLKNSFPEAQECLGEARTFEVSPRTIVILEGREDETESVETDDTCQNERSSQDNQ